MQKTKIDLEARCISQDSSALSSTKKAGKKFREKRVLFCQPPYGVHRLINGYRRCTTAPKCAPKTVKKRHEITSYTARYGKNRFYDARYILLLLCKPDTIYSGFDTKYALDMYRKSAIIESTESAKRRLLGFAAGEKRKGKLNV